METPSEPSVASISVPVPHGFEQVIIVDPPGLQYEKGAAKYNLAKMPLAFPAYTTKVPITVKLTRNDGTSATIIIPKGTPGDMVTSTKYKVGIPPEILAAAFPPIITPTTTSIPYNGTGGRRRTRTRRSKRLARRRRRISHRKY